MYETMAGKTIKVKGEIPFTKIKQITFATRVNAHPELKLEGYLQKESGYRLEEQRLEGKHCQITDTEKGSVIFAGIYEAVHIKYENELVSVTACLTGCTKLLDYEKKSRTYQDVTATYEQIVNEVLSAMPEAGALYSPQAANPIGVPLLQYQETDWEFLKRLASMEELSLLSDCQAAAPRFTFGEKKSKGTRLQKNQYQKQMSPKFYTDGGAAAGRYQADYMGIAFPDRQNIPLEEEVIMGQETYMVWEQSGCLAEGELRYEYKAGRKGYFLQPFLRRPELEGISLCGKVKETKGEIVKVTLDMDKNRSGTAGCEFPWLPITGNGFYCMPETNSQVRVCFSGKKPYADTSPRTIGATWEESAVPSKRSLKSEGGKSLLMYPNHMSLESTPTQQIRLEQMLLLKSHQPLKLEAEQSVEIEAPVIILTSPQQIESICTNKPPCRNNPPTGGTTSLIMQYQFDMLGEQGVLCGWEHVSYSPFQDAPEEAFHLEGLLVNLVLGVAITALLVVASIATGGVVAGILLGAAVGAGVATATMTVADVISGQPRSVEAAHKKLEIGAATGGVAALIPGGGILMIGVGGVVEGIVERTLSDEETTLGDVVIDFVLSVAVGGTIDKVIKKLDVKKLRKLFGKVDDVTEDVIDEAAEDAVGIKGDSGAGKYKLTDNLKAHIENVDVNVPRKRGIGGAHKKDVFMQNDIKVISETPNPNIDGVTTIEYQMPKLDKTGTPIPGEYQSGVPKVKTVYDSNIISTDEYLNKGLQAANNAASQSSNGVLSREWVGVDNNGVTWRGYFENGEITSMYPEY